MCLRPTAAKGKQDGNVIRCLSRSITARAWVADGADQRIGHKPELPLVEGLPGTELSSAPSLAACGVLLDVTGARFEIDSARSVRRRDSFTPRLVSEIHGSTSCFQLHSGCYPELKRFAWADCLASARH